MQIYLPAKAPVRVDVGTWETGRAGQNPMPASADFKVIERHTGRDALTLNLSADVDPALAQTQALVRRAAAQRCVWLAGRMLSAFRAGGIPVQIDRYRWTLARADDSTVAIWDVAWVFSEVGGQGYAGRAKMACKMVTSDVDRKPDIGEALIRRGGNLLEVGGKNLHGAIFAAQNETVFGVR